MELFASMCFTAIQVVLNSWTMNVHGCPQGKFLY